MGGGGGSSKRQYDREYNRRMATIAEAQQALSEEMMGYYREHQLPVDIAMARSEMEMLPLRTAFEKDQIGFERDRMEAERGLIPYMTDAQRASFQHTIDTTPARTEHDLAQYQYGTEHFGALSRLLPEKEAVTSKFLQEAREGVDRGVWASRAGADIAQGFSGARGALTREAGRMGIAPGSERMVRGLSSLARDEALQTASAQTHARRSADDENFRRLQSAAGL